MPKWNAPKRKYKRLPTINVEISIPAVASVITCNRSFLKLFASICMEPANNRKPSILFINMLWKSIEVIILISIADRAGNRLLEMSSKTEKAKDNTIMPIVGGHLIYL